MSQKLFLACCVGIATAAFGADGPCVVSGQSHFRIHVGTAGLFGAFAHNHLIEAEEIMGCATIDSKEITRSSIKLDFPADRIRVIDSNESAKDRADVQKTMESEVLRVTEFPRVTFESTSVERQATDRLLIHGNLTIRGRTQRVMIPVIVVALKDGTYRATGEYKFNQTTFGIKPIKLAGGTVKVKDEVTIEFELFLC
jgi:polyisoprenoid-binding protein YceI